MSNCTPNFKLELKNSSNQTLQSWNIRQQNLDCILCASLNITNAKLILAETRFSASYIDIEGTLEDTLFSERYIINSSVAIEMNTTDEYKIKLCKDECECKEDIVHESRKYFVYKKCNSSSDINYYFDYVDANATVDPTIIALILLEELDEYNWIDGIQDLTGPYGKNTSYGPAQFTPATLATLISDEYYNSVPGFSGNLDAESQLTALFNHIIDPVNSAEMISAYLNKTIDYWALGTIATGGKFSNNESRKADPGFDISDMPSVLGTLYSAGWQNLTGAANGVHNAPGASPRWADAFSTVNEAQIHLILFTDVDRDTLSDDEKLIYDIRGEINSAGGVILPYLNISSEENIIIGVKCVDCSTGVDERIDRSSEDYFVDSSGNTSKYMNIDVTDNSRAITEFECNRSNSN